MDKKYRIFKNGTIDNEIVCSEDFIDGYCRENGYTYEEIEEPQPPTPTPEPEPMTQAEVEEMLLDQEYRILLLEYGLEDEEV